MSRKQPPPLLEATEGVEARPATVADVQKIVAKAQKELELGFERGLERGLERFSKVVSEQLVSLSAEHQASALGQRRAMTGMSGRPAAARRTEAIASRASDLSAAPMEPSFKGVEGIAEDNVQGNGSQVVEVGSVEEAEPTRIATNSSQAFDEAKPTRITTNSSQAYDEVSTPRSRAWSEANSLQLRHLEREQNHWDIAKSLGFDALEDKVKRSRTPISKDASKRQKLDMTGLQSLVQSSVFEKVCGIVIFTNAVLIGFHANKRAISPTVFCEHFWLDIFFIFNMFFAVEVMLRIAAAGLEFFFGPDLRWNLFDFTIVVASVIEEIIQRSIMTGDCSTGDMGKGFTIVRIVRVLRLVRMVRAFRSMSVFRDFRVMASSILQCLIPLFWACILLVFVHWIFGVYFVHYVSDHVQDVLKLGDSITQIEADKLEKMREHFGSLWLAMYTLFRSVTGGMDWTDAAQSIVDVTDSHHSTIIYVLFIALMTFAVLNVVTGVFVENATKTALHDRDLIIQEKLERRNTYMKDALAVFNEADTDHSGTVSFTEFEALVLDPRVQAFFSCLELDLMEARRLFRLMDFDGNGQISPKEFVTGCMCLKGSAKTMDVAALLLEVRRISELWSQSMDYLDERFEQLNGGLRGASRSDASDDTVVSF